MMELALRNGDYVPDYAGGVQRLTGRDALLQRVMFRLTARRGTFPFREDLGSRLWQLGQVSTSARQAAAKQYVTEALAEETELTVEGVTLVQQETDAALTVELSYEGETLSVTVELQI
jgi:phage gp46-like protein